MENIIAERTLTLEVDGEQPTSIRVIVGKPEMVDEGEWVAPYEIHGPGPDEVERRELRGVDAWQALRLTLWYVPQAIENLVGHRGRLTWKGDPNWRDDPPPTPPV